MSIYIILSEKQAIKERYGRAESGRVGPERADLRVPKDKQYFETYAKTILQFFRLTNFSF